MTDQLSDQATLVANLFDRLAAGDSAAQRVETHISTVLLAGDYAYKIKKPLDLGFLDFSTLQRRRYCCEEEIRLNRRLAPDIYLDVVSICGSVQQPVLGGKGQAIEYAVRMRRFDQRALLSRNDSALTPELAEQIAETLAGFHHRIPSAPLDQPFGRPETVLFPMRQNFTQLRERTGDSAVLQTLDRLEKWTLKRYAALQPLIAKRREQGFVRECHGDLHLGNIALERGRLIIFDGIEFNPELRWIDTVNELAFLLMDLDDAGRPELAQLILNGYLQRSGDFSGLPLLRFYQVYRAMVRSKVAAIQLQQTAAGRQREGLTAALASYLARALHYTKRAAPALLITHGLSGSGKSTVSAELMQCLPAVRLRSDVERKRLAGLQAGADSRSAIGVGIYSSDFSAKTYDRLHDLARGILRAGFIVVVDATFLQAGLRRAFAGLADQLGVPFLILDFQIPAAELRRRVADRSRLKTDASEADLAVLEGQLSTADGLSAEELRQALIITPTKPVDLGELKARLSSQADALSC